MKLPSCFAAVVVLLAAMVAAPAMAQQKPKYHPPPAQEKPKVLVTAAAGGGHNVVLNWNPSTDGAANPTLGYNVYQGTVSGGESTTALNGTALVAVNCTSLTNCTYTISGVSPGNYFYTVKASLNGALSNSSNEATVTVPLATPTGLTATGA